jgi:hypothetical protein
MKNPLTMIALAIIFNVNAQKYNFRTTGNENDGFGVGEFNTASGLSALANIIEAKYNSAFGNTSLNQNKTGNNNTASGFASLLNNIEGSNNSAFGFKALHSNESGNYNTACGYQALYNTKGNSNTGLGYDARTSIIEATNQTVIGYNAIGRADNSVTLGNPEVTAVYMGEDSGATVHAKKLNIDNTEITAEELKLLKGGTLSSVTKNNNTGFRLSSHSDTNYGDVGDKAVDLSYSDTKNATYGATGSYSLASGYQTTASGSNSLASGYQTTASGTYSTAMGFYATASGYISTAIGKATASDYGSFAMGQHNKALSTLTEGGDRTTYSVNNTAFVIGNGTGTNNKSDAFKVMFNGDATIGNNLNVNGELKIKGELFPLEKMKLVDIVEGGVLASVTENGKTGVRLSSHSDTNYGDIGSKAVDLSYSDSENSKYGATGNNSLASGYQTKASGTYSTAMGNNTKAEAMNSIAMGNNTTAYAMNSTAIGTNSTASAFNSMAMGTGSTASAAYSMAIGLNTIASGMYSTAMGVATEARGINSTAMGNNTKATDYGSFVIGQYNDALSSVTSGGSSTAYNANNIAFVIGNGTPSAKSDAFKVKFNGDATIGNNLSIGGKLIINEKEITFEKMDKLDKLDGGILSSVTENNNTGFRLSSHSDTNYGDIGNKAVDLSYSDTKNATPRGASADYSLATGLNTTASGKNSTAMGMNTTASDYGSFVIGQYNDALSSITSGGSATDYNADNTAFVIGNGTSNAKSDAFKVKFNGNTTVSNNLTVSGDVVISSDARLKANIVSLGSTLSKLLLIDGKTYTMKKNSKQKIGVLAQDIQKVFPELVSKDENEMLAVNYQGLVPVLINALKEQHTKISRLEHLVNKLIADK